MAGSVPDVLLRVARPQIAARDPRVAAPRAGPGMTSATWPKSLHMIPIAGQRIDDRDLLHREVRHDLDVVLVHDQHFLDAHAIAVALAVLRLERERHALLDLDRVVERPDARDHRRIVLRKPETMAPQVGGGLVFVLVAPGLHR